MAQDQVVDYDQYPRSLLRSQAPLAFGEPTVESLDCYVERLTSVHDVQRKDLECFVTGDTDPVRRATGKVEPVRPDSPWPTSYGFASALAQFTQQPNVARLGLGWMHGVLSGAEALKPFSAWCSLCLRDAHYGRVAHCKPLSWSIKAVEACTIHGVVLSTSCSNCGAAVGLRSALKYPFELCPHCAVPLFKSSELDSFQEPLASEEQMLIAKQVGEMLASLPMLPAESVRKPDLRAIIDSCTRRGIGGTSYLLRAAHMSKGTLSALLHGAKAGLDTWVRVALAADMSLAGMFANELWKEDFSGNPIAWTPTLTTRRKYRPIDWREMRIKGEELIASGNCKGFYTFCRDMQIDPNQAGKMMGDMRTSLSDAGTTTATQARAKRVALLASQIESTVQTWEQEGSRISARAMAKHVRMSRVSVDFVLAYQKAIADTELAPYVGRRVRIRGASADAPLDSRSA